MSLPVYILLQQLAIIFEYDLDIIGDHRGGKNVSLPESLPFNGPSHQSKDPS